MAPDAMTRNRGLGWATAGLVARLAAGVAAMWREHAAA